MKTNCFKVVWAALCAWLTVLLLLWLDAELGLSDRIFSVFCNYIRSYGIPVRKFLFIALFLFYLITGKHKILGPAILTVTGYIYLIKDGALLIPTLYYGCKYLMEKKDVITSFVCDALNI